MHFKCFLKLCCQLKKPIWGQHLEQISGQLSLVQNSLKEYIEILEFILNLTIFNSSDINTLVVKFVNY